jgi:hypothetical protein
MSMREICDSILKIGLIRVAVRDTVFLSSCLLLTGFRPHPSVFRAATHITTPCVHTTDHEIPNANYMAPLVRKAVLKYKCQTEIDLLVTDGASDMTANLGPGTRPEPATTTHGGYGRNTTGGWVADDPRVVPLRPRACGGWWCWVWCTGAWS